MQVTSTQEGRTRIPSIATPCEASYFNICNIYTCMVKEEFFLNIIEKLSDLRGKQFALFYILLRPGHLALLQLYATLHRDVKMSSSILKSRVVKQTFVVNS